MIRRGIGVQSFVSAGGVPTDADAQAFITAAGITDATQQTAINTLVTDLKGYGIWSKMKAIYPFVGGTSSTHKWNLKDPRDLDAAFRLVFSGGWTHSSTGALPNGVNAYADTKLIPSVSISSKNSMHLSYYINQNVKSGAFQMGLRGSNFTDTFIGARFNSTQNYNSLNFNGSGSFYNETSNVNGFLTLSRISSTEYKYFKNNVLNQTYTKTSFNLSDVYSIYLACINLVGSAYLYDTAQIAFSSIGDGLTDTETTNLYTAVQDYQTILGRNV